MVSVRWRPLLSTHPCKRFWKFCITHCSMVGEIAATSSLMLCFKSSVVLGFFSYTLLLRYSQRKKSQALRSGDLQGHSIFPLREITRAGNISLRALIAIPAVWAHTVWFQQDGATDTIFRKSILQLKCFVIKLTLAINSLKKIVHFSFYFNLKIVRYFCRTLYNKSSLPTYNIWTDCYLKYSYFQCTPG
jgi:hypothetical protein